jgi:predicted nucleic acid-binding protein
MSELRVWTGSPVVVDSSVAFKWLVDGEPGKEAADELLERHACDEIALLAPAHLPLEVINGLQCRGTAIQDLEMAIRLLADAELLIAPVEDALLVEAVRIARGQRIALYDAVFIALAVHLDAELVTADRRQATTTSCRVRLLP